LYCQDNFARDYNACYVQLTDNETPTKPAEDMLLSACCSRLGGTANIPPERRVPIGFLRFTSWSHPDHKVTGRLLSRRVQCFGHFAPLAGGVSGAKSSTMFRRSGRNVAALTALRAAHCQGGCGEASSFLFDLGIVRLRRVGRGSRHATADAPHAASAVGREIARFIQRADSH